MQPCLLRTEQALRRGKFPIGLDPVHFSTHPLISYLATLALYECISEAFETSRLIFCLYIDM